MLNRHETREKIVFSLYQHLLLNKDLVTSFSNNFEHQDDFTFQIMQDLIVNEEEYILLISKYLIKWTFDRLNKVEQAILLEAVSEMKLNLNESAVIIDEAVILSKMYGDDDSYKYINGVLDNICKN